MRNKTVFNLIKFSDENFSNCDLPFSNLGSKLSKRRKDYHYSNSVMRGRKERVNNLVTEQNYSREEASVHAEEFDISKLMENYKVKLLWQKMKGNLERRNEIEKKTLFSVMENPEEGTWEGSSNWVSTYIKY